MAAPLDLSQYDLGNTQHAAHAKVELAGFFKDHKYEHLIHVFADLYLITSKESNRQLAACEATQAVAEAVLPQMVNVYQQFAVANSVVSIYVKCQAPVPEVWAKCYLKFSRLLYLEELNLEAAKAAGLAVVAVKK